MSGCLVSFNTLKAYLYLLSLVHSIICFLYSVRIMQSRGVVKTWAHRTHLDGVFFQCRRAPGAAGWWRPARRVSDTTLSTLDSGHSGLRCPGVRERLLPAGRGARPPAGGHSVGGVSALSFRQQQGKFSLVGWLLLLFYHLFQGYHSLC